jgi:ADP-ribose pyrophosphatase YjhB (NUDIX family)
MQVMLKDLVGKIWRKLPAVARLKIIRASQTKFTVSVGVVVFDERERILLLDHVLRPKSGWGIPGGFINAGEQPEHATHREIREETGLKLENVELWRIETRKLHVEMIFFAVGRGTAEVKSREIKSAKWFESNDLPKDLPLTQKYIIGEVLKFKERAKK